MSVVTARRGLGRLTSSLLCSQGTQNITLSLTEGAGTTSTQERFSDHWLDLVQASTAWEQTRSQEGCGELWAFTLRPILFVALVVTNQTPSFVASYQLASPLSRGVTTGGRQFET